jgi:hypothetical protein
MDQPTTAVAMLLLGVSGKAALAARGSFTVEAARKFCCKEISSSFFVSSFILTNGSLFFQQFCVFLFGT